MMVLDLAGDAPGVVFPEKELRNILRNAEFYEHKFLDFFRVVILAYSKAAKLGRTAEFKDIESWIQENYIELRHHLPDDLKRLYLTEIAFPPR